MFVYSSFLKGCAVILMCATLTGVLELSPNTFLLVKVIFFAFFCLGSFRHVLDNLHNKLQRSRGWGNGGSTADSLMSPSPSLHVSFGSYWILKQWCALLFYTRRDREKQAVPGPSLFLDGRSCCKMGPLCRNSTHSHLWRAKCSSQMCICLLMNLGLIGDN